MLNTYQEFNDFFNEVVTAFNSIFETDRNEINPVLDKITVLIEHSYLPGGCIFNVGEEERINPLYCEFLKNILEAKKMLTELKFLEDELNSELDNELDDEGIELVTEAEHTADLLDETFKCLQIAQNSLEKLNKNKNQEFICNKLDKKRVDMMLR